LVVEQPPSCGHRVQTKIQGLIGTPLCTPPPGVPRGSTTESQGMERASWGGGFSDWNHMLYNSSPFNRRPDTHTNKLHTSLILLQLRYKFEKQNLYGACTEHVGQTCQVPYQATYVFMRKKDPLSLVVPLRPRPPLSHLVASSIVATQTTDQL
jgi:hypothetical protein